MRIVFVGGGEFAVGTAELLVDRGHDVVIIERELDRIKQLRENLDCGYIHGDGSVPRILEEAAPKKCDFLFCLTDNDRDNIIASLVGRSIGYSRVVTRIEDRGFESVCRELGLSDLVVPSRTISRYLADMVDGRDIGELSTAIKNEARLFSFDARAEDAVAIKDLDLPKHARVICLYRDGAFQLTDENARIEEGDEVVLLTHSDSLPELRDRWDPERNDDGEEQSSE